MMTSPIRRRFLVLPVLFAALLGLFSPALIGGQTVEAVDPFYENLLEEGKFYYANGKPAEAIANMEIAFFGFLDNPSKLAECYLYLAVCHFQLKDYEKVKYYMGEIQRLKLEDIILGLNPPQNVAEKYAEITAKMNKSEGKPSGKKGR